MRVLKLGIYYETYLAWFYRANPSCALNDYRRQHALLLADCFGSSDFWTNALSRLGYETIEIVANAQPLQFRWAEENGVTADPTRWLFEISAAQICTFAPDVLIVADYSTFTAEHIRTLRERCPSIRLVAGWCGAPYHDPSVFREWDIVLSCVPELIDDFRAQGHVSRHLHHSFDPRVLDRIDRRAEPSCDFSFVGSIVKAPRFHNERDAILSSLLETTPLEIWSEALPTGWSSAVGDSGRPPPPAEPGGIARRIRRLLRWSDNVGRGGAGEVRPLTRFHSPVFGRRMFQQLSDSRVTLNTHIDVAARSASNMRLFEATGAGTCLLTDWKPNLHELFDDDEVVSYSSAAECADKVRYLLNHATERQHIAAAGQRRTLRDHNVDTRARRLDEIIRDGLSSG